LLGNAGLEASQAKDSLNDATARKDDAVNRRDSFAGVNIDEELSLMVVLQNSYSAAARVLTTASDMYDTLLNMVR
jgi:flagellar hook-associated protein 1 FlgK